jgi:hypothetical protein
MTTGIISLALSLDGYWALSRISARPLAVVAVPVVAGRARRRSAP